MSSLGEAWADARLDPSQLDVDVEKVQADLEKTAQEWDRILSIVAEIGVQTKEADAEIRAAAREWRSALGDIDAVVKANVDQAMADLAAVQVVADEIDGQTINVTVDVDRSAVDAFDLTGLSADIETVSAELEAASAEWGKLVAVEVDVSMGEDLVTEPLTAHRKEWQTLVDSVTVRPAFDGTATTAEIESAVGTWGELVDTVTVRPNFDGKTIAADIEAHHAEWEEMLKVTATVRADTAVASADLAAVAAEANRLDGRNINVEVAVSNADVVAQLAAVDAFTASDRSAQVDVRLDASQVLTDAGEIVAAVEFLDGRRVAIDVAVAAADAMAELAAVAAAAAAVDGFAAHITVDADTTVAQTRVETLVASRPPPISVPVRVDTDRFESDLRRVGARLRGERVNWQRVLSLTATVDVSTVGSDDEVRAAAERWSALASATGDIKVDPTAALGGIESVRSAAEQLDGTVANVTLDATVVDAVAKLEAVKALMDEVCVGCDIAVDVNLGSSIEDLAALKAAVEAACGDQRIDITVDKDGSLDDLASNITGIDGSVAGLADTFDGLSAATQVDTSGLAPLSGSLDDVTGAADAARRSVASAANQVSDFGDLDASPRIEIPEDALRVVWSIGDALGQLPDEIQTSVTVADPDSTIGRITALRDTLDQFAQYAQNVEVRARVDETSLLVAASELRGGIPESLTASLGVDLDGLEADLVAATAEVEATAAVWEQTANVVANFGLDTTEAKVALAEFEAAHGRLSIVADVRAEAAAALAELAALDVYAESLDGKNIEISAEANAAGFDRLRESVDGSVVRLGRLRALADQLAAQLDNLALTGEDINIRVGVDGAAETVAELGAVAAAAETARAVGNVTIQVGVDEDALLETFKRTKFQDLLKKFSRTDAGRLAVTANVDFSKANIQEGLADLSKRLRVSGLPEMSREVEAFKNEIDALFKLGERKDFGSGLFGTIRRQLQSIKDYKVQVDMDASTATGELSILSRLWKRLAHVTGDVGLDTKGGYAEAVTFSRFAGRLIGKIKANVNVDTAGAVTRLLSFKALGDRILRLKANVDTDGLSSSLTTALGSIGKIPGLIAARLSNRSQSSGSLFSGIASFLKDGFDKAVSAVFGGSGPAGAGPSLFTRIGGAVSSQVGGINDLFSNLFGNATEHMGAFSQMAMKWLPAIVGIIAVIISGLTSLVSAAGGLIGVAAGFATLAVSMGGAAAAAGVLGVALNQDLLAQVKVGLGELKAGVAAVTRDAGAQLIAQFQGPLIAILTAIAGNAAKLTQIFVSPIATAALNWLRTFNALLASNTGQQFVASLASGLAHIVDLFTQFLPPYLDLANDLVGKSSGIYDFLNAILTLGLQSKGLWLSLGNALSVFSEVMVRVGETAIPTVTKLLDAMSGFFGSNQFAEWMDFFNVAVDLVIEFFSAFGKGFAWVDDAVGGSSTLFNSILGVMKALVPVAQVLGVAFGGVLIIFKSLVIFGLRIGQLLGNVFAEAAQAVIHLVLLAGQAFDKLTPGKGKNRVTQWAEDQLNSIQQWQDRGNAAVSDMVAGLVDGSTTVQGFTTDTLGMRDAVVDTSFEVGGLGATLQELGFDANGADSDIAKLTERFARTSKAAGELRTLVSGPFQLKVDFAPQQLDLSALFQTGDPNPNDNIDQEVVTNGLSAVIAEAERQADEQVRKAAFVRRLRAGGFLDLAAQIAKLDGLALENAIAEIGESSLRGAAKFEQRIDAAVAKVSAGTNPLQKAVDDLTDSVNAKIKQTQILHLLEAAGFTNLADVFAGFTEPADIAAANKSFDAIGIEGAKALENQLRFIKDAGIKAAVIEDPVAAALQAAVSTPGAKLTPKMLQGLGISQNDIASAFSSIIAFDPASKTKFVKGSAASRIGLVADSASVGAKMRDRFGNEWAYKGEGGWSLSKRATGQQFSGKAVVDVLGDLTLANGESAAAAVARLERFDRVGAVIIDQVGATWTYIGDGKWKMTEAPEFIGGESAQVDKNLSAVVAEAVKLSRGRPIFRGGQEVDRLFTEDEARWRDLLNGTRSAADDVEAKIVALAQLRIGNTSVGAGQTATEQSAAQYSGQIRDSFISGLQSDAGGSTADLDGAVTNIVGQVHTALGTAVESSSQTTMNLGAKIPQDFATGIADPGQSFSFDAVIGMILKVAQAIETGIAVYQPQLIVAGFAIPQAFGLGIAVGSSTEAEPAATAMVTNTVTAAANAALMEAPTFLAVANQLMQSFVDGINAATTTKAEPAGVGFVLAVTDGITNAADLQGDELSRIGLVVIGRFAEGVSLGNQGAYDAGAAIVRSLAFGVIVAAVNNEPLLTAAALIALGALTSTFAKNAAGVADTGYQLGSNVITVLSHGVTDMATGPYMQKAVDDAVVHLGELFGPGNPAAMGAVSQASALGMAVGMSLANGLIYSRAFVEKARDDLVKAIGTTFLFGTLDKVGGRVEASTGGKQNNGTASAMFTQGVQIGQALGNGIEAGVNMSTVKVLTAVMRMASLSIAVLNAIFQTRSPSKVTEAIGVHVVDGLVSGIMSGHTAAAEAARGLAKTVASELKSGVGDIPVSASLVQTGALTPVQTQDVAAASRIVPFPYERQTPGSYSAATAPQAPAAPPAAPAPQPSSSPVFHVEKMEVISPNPEAVPGVLWEKTGNEAWRLGFET